VGAARDELGDLGVVVDVREAEPHLAVGHDVEEVEAARRRHVARLEQADDSRCAALRIRAERFFFLRGEAAVGIADREAAVP
jgi:hypothetical protein